MQVDTTQYTLTDPMLVYIQKAYDDGVENDGPPCKVCADHPEQQGRRIHFHGSDFGACPRKVGFKLALGGEFKVYGTKAAFLENGHVQESLILSKLKKQLPVTIAKNDMQITIDVPMVSDMDSINLYMDKGIAPNQFDQVRKLKIIGHIDGLLRFGEGDYDEAILECKSVGASTWADVKTGKISDEWYGQIQCYLFLMRLDRAYLLVHNRGTSELMKPIRIDYDKEYCTKRIRILINIYKAVNKGMEVPKSEAYKSTCSECRNCPFRDRCYSSDAPKFESKPTKAELKAALATKMLVDEDGTKYKPNNAFTTLPMPTLKPVVEDDYDWLK